MLLIVAALILAAPFLMAWHFRRQTERLRIADAVWGNVVQHAQQLLEDRTLSPAVGDFVEFIVSHTGSGMMTRAFLRSLVWKSQPKGESKFQDQVECMNAGQKSHFARFIIDCMLYDSLRTSISGVILRRVLYWLMATAEDEKVPVSRAQVMPMAFAAGRAYQPAPC